MCAELAVGEERREPTYLLSDVVKLDTMIEKLADQRPFRMLVDVRQIRRDEPGVRRKKPLPNNQRMAMLVSNPVTRMLANSYLCVARPATPTRVFSSKEKALRWLMS